MPAARSWNFDILRQGYAMAPLLATLPVRGAEGSPTVEAQDNVVHDVGGGKIVFAPANHGKFVDAG
jgi:hypothetical protein